MGACRGPLFLSRSQEGTDLKMIVKEVPLLWSAWRGPSFYRVATLFFLLCGAAAAFFGAGHGAWKPYPRKGSVWVTHMLPRLLGPGAPCHSHGCAPYR